ncbi:unnamed protein product [Calypogeia fissa]
MTTHHSSRTCAAIVLVCFLLHRGSFGGVFVDHINVGFTASPIKFVDVNGLFLYSVNQSFALGFSSFDAGDNNPYYYLCIQHFSSSQDVWCANRNNPIRRTDSFSFSSDGSVSLQLSGSVIWSINSTGASTLQLQETGNLVLLNNKSDILWQSFDYPTDTILTGQMFSSKMKLIGGKSQGDISEGSYYMSLDAITGLALRADLYSPPQSPLIYWTMSSDGKTSQLDPTGVPAFAEIDMNTLKLLQSDGASSCSEILLDGYGPTIRRATLEYDGNLRVYFLSGSLWNLAFTAVRDVCSLPDHCGPYGICSGSSGQCSCPESFVANNITDFSQGCSLDGAPSCSNHSVAPFEMLYIGNVDYFADQFTEPQGPPSDLNTCRGLCLGNCSCTALFFHNESGSCYLWGEIGTIGSGSLGSHLAYMKVPQNIQAGGAPGSGHSGSGGIAAFVVVLIAVGTTFIIVGLFIGAWRVYKSRLAQQLQPNGEEEDELLAGIPGLPTRFSYKELEAATFGFRDKLGQGGFGSVYEGVLGDNTKIAVKRLESVGQGKKEFWAEVATIGSIHHVHLVQLRGFCAEGAHRLLVYEFMANGSLAKVLFSKKQDEIVLDWNTRCKICLGTARGLAYLHDDCRERILHCDIKPENILLDENLVAKVSDFGLAKLMNPEQSEVFTTLRGTRGYLAPEWLLNSAISDKSDVYSFGMVLLELISGRKNFDHTESSEKSYFPEYAYQQTENENVEGLVDPKLDGLANDSQVATLTRIALWCIQDEVAIRPSMKKVVKMIEGIIEVPKPPSSPQLAVRLHGPRFDSGNSSSGLFDYSPSITASRLSAPR